MKTPTLLFAVCLIFGAGCSTPHSVTKLEGRGTKQLFDSQYSTVWIAVMGAVDRNDLRILDMNETTGHITARRVMGPTTFGENISIWVRAVAPYETEVEVVGRRSGPPVVPTPDPEQRLLHAIAELLPT